MNPLISILTPTYNRAELLVRAFNSLQLQSSYNFEWLIVDDGSTDETEKVVSNFETTNFPVRYYKKENGGKHTALNFGIKKARGQYILMLDSDDILPNNATEIIFDKVKNLPTSLGGVSGRKADLNGKIVGSENNFDNLITNSIDIRYKYGIEGDLTEVFKTSVFKQYQFPEIEGEKFCPEALIWNRIARDYDMLFFNQPIYIADYQSSGLTSSIVKIRMNSPKSSMMHYSELASYDIPLKEKVKANINFWRFSFNEKDWSIKKKLSMVNCWLMPFCLPLGFLMYQNDKRKTS